MERTCLDRFKAEGGWPREASSIDSTSGDWCFIKRSAPTSQSPRPECGLLQRIDNFVLDLGSVNSSRCAAADPNFVSTDDAMRPKSRSSKMSPAPTLPIAVRL